MVDLMHSLTNLLFFDIPFLYYHISLDSSIMHIYLSFGVSDSSIASLFCERIEDFFETLAILSAILLQIKSPIASDVF